MPETVRMHLGEHPNMARGQLFEREVAALVIRAGHAAGFLVHAEVAAPWAKLSKRGKMPTIDYGWYVPTSNELLVAWELDGRDVADKHIAGDPTKGKPGNSRKLAGCTAAIKIQVLYSVTNHLRRKGGTRAAKIIKLLPADVRVLTDEELMAPAPNGISLIMSDARAAAKLPQR